MRLEDYFEFEKFQTKFGEVEQIRVKGSRVGIEHVIEAFRGGQSGERIMESYPSLTLEEVYATITYYLHNRPEIDAYIKRGEVIAEAFYQEHLQRGPSEAEKRLRAQRAQQEAASRPA
jgi:uncharacterized protein (DUF433 family)